MSHSHRLYRLLITLLVASMLLGPTQVPVTLAAPDAPAATVRPSSSGLYRTRVIVDSPARRARLEAMGVVVLAENTPTPALPLPGGGSEGGGQVVVLADGDQLETLARLGFRPQASDDLAGLSAAAGPEKAWLTESLKPLLAQAEIVQAQRAATEAAGASAAAAPDGITALRAAMQALTPEQTTGIAGYPSNDFDGDGLSDTQETWWCTDPMNPDSDGDGVSDKAEVVALKDWMNNHRAGPPASGKPFAGWPPQTTSAGNPGRTFACQDDDRDSVPDLAERWELGLNMNRESTDRDKFDDGQELFGYTNCPGGDASCGYGDLPRSADIGFVGAAMPSWVKAPGNHPLVAAFPVPEVDVQQSSLHVQTVTTVTTDHVIGQGTEKSYSTSDTTGIEVSSSDTTTWNEWEENSVTRPLTQAAAQGVAQPTGKDPLGAWKLFDGRSTTYRKLARGAESAENLGTAFEAAKILGTGIGYGLNWMVYEGALLANGQPLDLDFSRDDYDPNGALAEAEANRKEEARWEEFLGAVSGGSNLAENGALYASNHDMCGVPNPHSPVVGSDGRTRLQTGYPMQYPVPRPVVTQTSTKGSSHGGAHTETTSKSESHTVTNGEAFSNSESWGNATAQDSAHAADLWFTYKVRNSGTDFARQLKHLVFNIYIGDEDDPACSYHVGSTQCGVPVDTVLFSNLMPNEEHSYTSFRIPITLEQMKAIDLGGPIRISVEEFDYGADELFYQDAKQGGLLVEIDDGSDDGEEEINGYLIPTYGDETILEVAAHYLPHEEDADTGTVTAFWTPEKAATQPAWCQSGWQQGEMWWCKHALSTADWWNVTTSNAGATGEGFENTPAVPGATVLFRFNTDSDFDGYSDRSELRLGTLPNDPLSYPKPELLAGVYSTRNGNTATATLSLLNTGPYDAYGVEAVMIAPDDTISVTHNTVGGSGRVRATQQVVVGNRISLVAPSTAWQQSGHAWPAVGGYYTAQQDRTYTFQVNCANQGGCDVGAGSWTVGWSDGAGVSNSLNFGAGYASPALKNVGDYGVKVGLVSGRVYNGDTFTINAHISRATFNYVINREPHTDPIVLVSYNDPQGNHRFGIPSSAMALSNPTANLSGFSGQMLQEPGMNIVSTAPAGSGPQTAQLVVNNPTGVTLQNAHLFLDIVTVTDTAKIAGGAVPAGKILAEIVATTNLPAGPSIQPMTFDLANYTTATTQEYILLALATDYQGNVLATAARPLSSFQEDPKPAFAMADADVTWDFGTASQGTLLKRSFTFANTGALDLLTYVSAPAGLTVSQTGSRRVGMADMTTYDMALNTASLGVGPYEGTITIRTSDPDARERTVHVVGTVTAAPADTPVGAMQRPLDTAALVSGTQGQWVDFTHTLGPDPQTLHPVKVWSQDYSTLKGVGKYATPFGAGTASYDLFGDGRDGDLTVTSGQTTYADEVRTSLVGTATAGQTTVPLATTAGFQAGDGILIIQVQGPGAGNYEFRTVTAVNSTSLNLSQGLRNSYSSFDSSGSPSVVLYEHPNYSGRAESFGADDSCLTDNYIGNDAVSSIQVSPGTIATLYEHCNYAGAAETFSADDSDLGNNSIGHDRTSSIRVTSQYQSHPRAQILRIPQYRNLTVQIGGVLTVHPWDGTTGGVLAFLVSNVLSINGTVSAKGQDGQIYKDFQVAGGIGGGFRGGQGVGGAGISEQGWYGGQQGEGTVGVGQYYSYSDFYANGNGGGGGTKTPAAGFGRAPGGGGGNGTTGGNGTASVDAATVGLGGTTAGSINLASMVFGGGGGGGMSTNTAEWVGGGGSGGGIVFISGAVVNVSGTIVADGGAGGSPGIGQNGDRDAGGGGAGGSIFIKAQTASLGSGLVTSRGGAGGYTPNGNGGDGGAGRIHVDYCTSITGLTNPVADTAKLNCYLVEQIESFPYTGTRLNLPASGTNTYQVQYGRKLNWGGAANQVTTLRVPAGLFTSVTLQALVSDLPSNAWFALDVGNTGSDSWNGTVGNGGEYTSPNLAAYFNTYWKNHDAPTTGYLDVPIRVYLDRAGQVLLTNLQVTPTGSKVRAIRLPVRPQGYSSVAVSLTVSGGSGPLAMGADVGANGSVDWKYTGSPAYPANLTAQGADLTAAINAYLAGKSGEVDVPIRFYLAPFATLNLTGLSATPVGGTDAGISAGDIAFSAPAPTEGNEVTVSAMLHNGGTLDTGPLTASFYATPPSAGGQGGAGTPWYIGSRLVANVPAGGTAQASLPWNTLGFTGEVPVRVTLDPFDHVAEANETNNQTTVSLTVKTRPDLSLDPITLSDDEPVAGETVTVTINVRNVGQTAAAAFAVSLADNNTQYPISTIQLPAVSTAAVTFAWTPTTPGPHRLFVRADRNGQVNESDEGNNDRWRDVYVGFGAALDLDSGGPTDVPYTTTLGYGYLNGEAITACGTGVEQSQRRDLGRNLRYQFDHLLPGHFYHLDIALAECDAAHRVETLLVNDMPVASALDLDDQAVHRLSLRLGPALYANHAIMAAITTTSALGAVVNRVALHDVDYRYADAGGANDQAYSAGLGYGYLDANSAAQLLWGGLPHQSIRINPDGNTLRYRFDHLAPAKRYQVNLTLYQGDTVNMIEEVLVDGLATGVIANLSDRQPHYLLVDVPVEAYRGDGSITVTIRRTNGPVGAYANEIALEEKTLLNLPIISDLQVSNVSSGRATVAWLTDAATDGAVHYGATAGLGAIGLDERGAPLSARTHLADLTGLAPETTYYFYAISADAIDDNGGGYYRLTTGPEISLNTPDLAFGRVLRADGTTLAAGALVRARLRDADAQGSPGDSAQLAALVEPSGYWNFDLAATRTADTNQLFDYSPTGDQLILEVTDGAGCTARQTVDTGHDAQAADMILVCPTQVTHPVANGWTLLGLSVEAEVAPTAEAALNNIVAQGGSAQEIERWWNGGWDAHVRGLPFNNFTLALGKGYFVRAGAASGWTRTGRPPASPLPLALYPGWNLVNLPKLPAALDAEAFLLGIAAQGGACSEVDRWDTATGGWKGHPKGVPINLFTLSQIEGYFVKCTKQSNYTPGAAVVSSRAPAPPTVEGITEQPAAAPAICDLLVANRRDVAFAVSWRTDQPSKGWVEYGPPGVLGLVARDDAGGVSTLHHVTVANLSPETAYAFRVHAGDQIADQGGQPFQVTTTATTPPGVPLTAFGQVQTAGGQPAVGALVRAWLEDSAGTRSEPLSTLTEEGGYWALSLPAEDCADRQLLLQVFAADGATAQHSGSACDVQPAPSLTLQVQPRIPVYLPMIGR